MQRKLLLSAYFFFPIAIGSVNAFAQQYPFVHYTPKDGLISNQVRNIYQDGKGRLYFTSVNGLSVYDGARFTNYSSKNGLDADLVNCVMEIGADSIWIVTNNREIQCLSNGKLKKVALKNPSFIIDNLVTDDKGNVYAASEQGLYKLRQDEFLKLPFIDITTGRDESAYISNIILVGAELLVMKDNTMLNADKRYILYLYDTGTKKVIAHREKIFAAARAPDGRIWVGTEKNILSVDTAELKKGKIVLQELPDIFNKIKNENPVSIYFDREGNCWISDRISVLKKINTDGAIISFTSTSGLSTPDVSHVFQDKEGTIWIATHSAGVDKLSHSNFSFSKEVSGLSAINYISYAEDKNKLLLSSSRNGKLIQINSNNLIKEYEFDKTIEFLEFIETPRGLYGISEHGIYNMKPSGKRLHAVTVFTDTVDKQFNAHVADKNGNLIISGRYYLTALINGKIIFRKKINHYIDQAAMDTDGNIWIAGRAKELIMYKTNPGDPANYLEQKFIFTKEISDVFPRSLAIDRNNIFWIGSRTNGLFAFQFEKGTLSRLFHLDESLGLSENFITRLTVDAYNNIWACSPAGLDKISIRNGIPVIENITKQNNIYQSVTNVVVDKNKIVWALLSNGLIKIAPESKQATGYFPTLMVSMIRSGKDTISEKPGTTLSYKQNNLSFYFAAPTFLDEKQVLYSYQLKGSANTDWTEPSNNAFVSFIDLHPGEYILNVKAKFPAGRYPEQTITYNFSIAPPWWQTWWLKILAGLFIIGLLIIAFRFYYRRKLEKQMAILEKQQAIEKERTRIASDMHDDLGAGLSRIKFLSENIKVKKMNDETIREDLEKISAYSDEMAEKMGEIVWALNEKNDTVADLIAFTRSYVLEYLSGQNIYCEINTPLQLPSTFITGEMRQHIFLSVKECLHNIVKHAGASEVYFSVRLNGGIEIIIHDNGKGINWDTMRPFSNGIENIKKRMNEIHGKAIFLNEEGTKVIMSVPLHV